MKNLLVVFEQTVTGYSAYSPLVNGVVATGKTEKEVSKNITEALIFHMEGLKELGEQVFLPKKSFTRYMDVTV